MRIMKQTGFEFTIRYAYKCALCVTLYVYIIVYKNNIERGAIDDGFSTSEIM